ncbi:MAG: MFS transporter [Hyphomicrobiales bacterium]|nr:MAG: MFS transporter [Hyphomicrobiales bacterium]
MNIQNTGPNTGSRVLSRFELIAIAAALMALNALAIDVMLPALPAMGEALGIINENDRQLVITVYMLGFGFAQIFFGPLADRFGRRGPLLCGLVVYVGVAFAAIWAPTYGALLALRLLQGMGAAATRVIATAVVRDCYSGRVMAEIMSLVFMVFMIIPIVAPAIGQLLLAFGPWWTIFLFMSGLALIISVWVYFRLPETLAEENRRSLSVRSITSAFVIVVTNRMAMSYTLAGAFMFGSLLGFVSTAQQVYVGIYELGVWFPLAFAGTAGLMALASFLNARVVGRYGMRRISHFAILVMIAASAIWVAVSLLGPVPFWAFFIFLSINMFMFSWVISNANSLSMEPLGAVAGTASGVIGFIQIVSGALLGMGIGQLFDGTITPTAISYLLMGICALLAMLYGEKGKLFGIGTEHLD